MREKVRAPFLIAKKFSVYSLPQGRERSRLFSLAKLTNPAAFLALKD
jgi:hypothetical protein